MNSEAPLDETEQKAMCENQAQSQGMVLQYTHGLKITGTPIHFQLKIEQLNTSLTILPCIASNLISLETTFSQWGVYTKLIIHHHQIIYHPISLQQKRLTPRVISLLINKERNDNVFQKNDSHHELFTIFNEKYTLQCLLYEYSFIKIFKISGDKKQSQMIIL